MIAQALPTSLRCLEANSVPAAVLTQLTLLERLSLLSLSSGGEPTCSLSALQQLTLLDLQYITDEDIPAIAGCSSLRTLCLNGE